MVPMDMEENDVDIYVNIEMVNVLGIWHMMKLQSSEMNKIPGHFYDWDVCCKWLVWCDHSFYSTLVLFNCLNS